MSAGINNSTGGSTSINNQNNIEEDFELELDKDDALLVYTATEPDDIPSLWKQTFLGSFNERYVYKIISDSQMVSLASLFHSCIFSRSAFDFKCTIASFHSAVAYRISHRHQTKTN